MVPSQIYTYFGVHDDVFCYFTVSNGITISDRLLLRAFKESTHYGRFRFVIKIVLVLCDHFWILHTWQFFPPKSKVALQNSLEQPYTTTLHPPLCSVPIVPRSKLTFNDWISVTLSGRYNFMDRNSDSDFEDDQQGNWSRHLFQYI